MMKARDIAYLVREKLHIPQDLRLADVPATLRTKPVSPSAVKDVSTETPDLMPLLAQMAVDAGDGRPFVKWWHYFGAYEDQFAELAQRSREGALDRPLRILEMGVWRGGSLDLWRQYFGPEAVIFGIDIDEVILSLGIHSAEVRVGSQTDETFLRAVVEEMGGVDVVIDDGSHQSKDVIASLRILFPLLSDSGTYVIEDLHTSYWPTWGGGFRRRGSSIEALKELIDTLHQPYYARSGRRNSVGIERDSLRSIQFYDSVAVLRKRACPEPQPFRGGDHSRPEASI
jgi:23S rRNA U2552 (ribose-2'-O)-methylase RlmE/FtsJ